MPLSERSQYLLTLCSALCCAQSASTLCIWNLHSSLHPLQSIHTYERASHSINALSWSPSHPDHFATLSSHARSVTEIWDLRTILSPVLSLRSLPSTAATSTHILYHPTVSYYLATALGPTMHVHDVRSTSAPLQTFHSPLSASLCSLSFSPYLPTLLLSSSESQQVELWSLPLLPEGADSGPASTEPQYRLQTERALRWAEFAPFGRGLVTLAESDHAVDVWSVGTKLGQASVDPSTHLTDVTSAARLTGHGRPIAHVQWYRSSTETASPSPVYQLFSLSDAGRLLVHTVPAFVRAVCGDDDAIAQMEGNGEGATELSEDVGEAQARRYRSSSALHAELVHCCRQLPAFRYHSFSSLERSCHAVIASDDPAHALHVLITFPASYPTLSPPAFALLPASSPMFHGSSYASSSFLRDVSHMAVTTDDRQHFALLPALSFLHRVVVDAVQSAGRSPSPPPPSGTPQSGKRKQVRISEKAQAPQSRNVQAPIRRGGPSSASTPTLSTLSSSLEEQRAYSSSLSSPGDLLDDESDDAAESVSDDEDNDEAIPMSPMEEGVEDAIDQESGGERLPEQSKEKERRDFELPCPRLCGASWGPRGELVLFNNFPQLTHYLTLTRLRRRRRHRDSLLGARDGSGGSTADGVPAEAQHEAVNGDHSGGSHHRHISFLPDHDDDDWTDIHQADVHDSSDDLITPRQLAGEVNVRGESEEGKESDEETVVFPPRSFGHLLQLPFYAAYLAPIIGEGRVEERDGGRAVMKGRRDNDDGEESHAENGDASMNDSAHERSMVTEDGTDTEEDSEDDSSNLNSAPLSTLASLGSAPTPARPQAAPVSPTGASSSPTDARRLLGAPLASPRTLNALISTPLRATVASVPLLPSAAIPSSATHRPFVLRASAAASEQSGAGEPSLLVNTSLLLCDLSSLFPLDPQLSSAYAFSTWRFLASSASSAQELSAHFQAAAQRCARPDLVRLWQLMQLVLRPELVTISDEEKDGRGWGGAAWGGGLIRQLMAQYWSRGDVETVGLLACLLSLVPASKALSHVVALSVPNTELRSPSPRPALTARSPASVRGLKPVHAVRSVSAHSSNSPTRSSGSRKLAAYSSSPTPLPSSMQRSHSGNADFGERLSPSPSSQGPASSSLPTYPMSLLSPPSPATPSALLHQSLSSASLTSSPQARRTAPAAVSLSVSVDDLYVLVYADYLHRMGLMQERATVLQCLTTLSAPSSPPALVDLVMGWSAKELRVDFDPICQRCGKAIAAPGEGAPSAGAGPGHRSASLAGSASELSSVRCPRCNVFSSHCAVCSLSLRGLSSFCLVCGHGGHMEHMRSWWEDAGEKECATGCGCRCLERAQLTSLNVAA